MAKSRLEQINAPEDLQKLSPEELPALCDEIRQMLIETVSHNGGHLASNLGVVELTVALLRSTDLRQDQIVWDVGHQCYTYKLLTGRRERFGTLRKENGISGFPRVDESEYDVFSTGHSSTSVASALGLAQAKACRGEPGTVFAILGDGALSGGLAYEGMNNAGRMHGGFVVILNDNKMSISRNVGSMARSLAVMRTRKGYLRFKSRLENALIRIPKVGRSLRNRVAQLKTMIKNAIYPSNIFEEMGFHYIGPIDGHDLSMLDQALQAAREEQDKPVLLHICTVKGKGYSFAEADPGVFHGIGEFDVETGERKVPGDSYSSKFGEVLCACAEKDDGVCAITAAMKTGTGLQNFADRYPNRFFDVGIAEEGAVTMAAGLSANGMKPVFAVYSTFLQRAYDQLLHDAALQNRKMVLAIDRAGFTGDDGESHQGLFDVAFLRTVPDITVYSPSCYEEQKNALETALFSDKGISAVRYPRGKEATEPLPEGFSGGTKPFDLQNVPEAELLIVTYGREFEECRKAVEILLGKGIGCALLKLNRILPIPEEAVLIAEGYRNILFAEEGIREGGIGEAFRMRLSEADYGGKYRLVAVEKGFEPQASVARQIERNGLSAEKIAEFVEKEFQK